MGSHVTAAGLVKRRAANSHSLDIGLILVGSTKRHSPLRERRKRDLNYHVGLSMLKRSLECSANKETTLFDREVRVAIFKIAFFSANAQVEGAMRRQSGCVRPRT
jgi:hypothetical protein